MTIDTTTPPQRGIFITLDGVDGVGKTLVTQLLSRRLQAVSYKCPTEPFVSKIKALPTDVDPMVRYELCLESNRHDGEIIRELVESGKNVVADRYVYSTLAYHAVLDERIASKFTMDGIFQPDMAVLLTASAELRRKRLTNRADLKPHEKDEKYQEAVQAFFENQKMFKVEVKDNNKPEYIIGEILTKLKRLKVPA